MDEIFPMVYGCVFSILGKYGIATPSAARMQTLKNDWMPFFRVQKGGRGYLFTSAININGSFGGFYTVRCIEKLIPC